MSRGVHVRYGVNTDWTPKKLHVEVAVPDKLSLGHLRAKGPQPGETLQPSVPSSGDLQSLRDCFQASCIFEVSARRPGPPPGETLQLLFPSSCVLSLRDCLPAMCAYGLSTLEPSLPCAKLVGTCMTRSIACTDLTTTCQCRKCHMC